MPEPQKAAIMIKMNKIEELEIGMNVQNNTEKELPEPQKAAIMIKMNKIEELEIGMKVMIVKDGKNQDSGTVIDILDDEILLQDREEGFSYKKSDLDGFIELM